MINGKILATARLLSNKLAATGFENKNSNKTRFISSIFNPANSAAFEIDTSFLAWSVSNIENLIDLKIKIVGEQKYNYACNICEDT